MRARRIMLTTALLLLGFALVAGLTSSPAPEPLPPAGVVGERAVVEETIPAESREETTVRARVGDVIRLRVEGDLLDAVLVERLDRLDAIEPTTPARFEILAEEPGLYPVRLVEADRRVGRLEISP